MLLRRLGVRVSCFSRNRWLATLQQQKPVLSVTQQKDEPTEKYGPSTLVAQLNTAFRKYPAESIASIFSLEAASIFTMHSLLTLSGVEFPAEFAIAFAMSRPFRRIRMPIEIGAATILRSLVPWLSDIKPSELVKMIPGMKTTTPISSDMKLTLTQRLTNFSMNTFDKFGAAYFLGARLVGVIIVLSLYSALRYGMDVSPLLAWLGVDDSSTLGNVLGTWAGAVTLSAAVYPFTIAATAFTAPALHKLRRRIINKKH